MCNETCTGLSVGPSVVSDAHVGYGRVEDIEAVVLCVPLPEEDALLEEESPPEVAPYDKDTGLM